MHSENILIIEDDKSTQRLLKLSLGALGYRVRQAASARAGLSSFRTHQPDIVLLDLGLPDADGLDVLRSIREVGAVPVVVISARGMESQKVQALDGGADDYVVKPFGIDELCARIRVALRHRQPAETQALSEIQIGDLHIDLDRRIVVVKDVQVHFTPIEYKMLLTLVANRGKVLTHRFIQQEVWGYPTTDDYQSLRVFMASVRRKIEDDAANPRYISTEVGVGYRFAEE